MSSSLYQLVMTEDHRLRLMGHLFPGDGCEAAAVALCGRANAGGRQRLLVHEVVLIPHARCRRTPDSLTWPTDDLVPLLERAERSGMAILKVHSHPGGFAWFSHVDDRADAELFASVHGWLGDGLPHASAIMLPDGSLVGRAMLVDGSSVPLERIIAIGDSIRIFLRRERLEASEAMEAASEANVQVLGKGTVQRLRRLRVGVIGCSGTGSIVIEQLARLGIGSLVLVDPDAVANRNLNRVVGTTAADARAERLKVQVLTEHVASLGFGTEVLVHPGKVFDLEALRLISTCDVIIGCLDRLVPREILTRMCSYYLVPYFDLGVRLVADGKGGITTVCGSVHYLQPGHSPLDARGVYRPEDLRAEQLLENDPGAYRRQLAEKYITGAGETSPPVISVNMFIAALAVNDVLARIHPYRTMGNGHTTMMANLGEMEITCQRQHAPDGELLRKVGRGDVAPILDLPRV